MILLGLDSPDSSDFGSRSGQILGWQDPNAVSGSMAGGASGGSAVNQVPMALPFGVTSIDTPPSVAFYDGRSYIVGGYSSNMVIDEAYTLWRQGILAPTDPPTVAGGSGSAGVAYWSFYDEVTGERSTLSAGVAILADAGTRTWTAMPLRPPDDVFISEGTVEALGTTKPGTMKTDDPRIRHFFLRPGDRTVISGLTRRILDVDGSRTFVVEPFIEVADVSGLTFEAFPLTRATHVELWIEEAGDFPRLVTRVILGTTELVESSTLATRGEAFQDSFERFPYCTVNAIYHDRQVMAGNPDAPDTVYVSELFFPERYTGLNFRTRNGEVVVSLLSTRDYCLVLTDKSSYILQGYTENDFTFTVADPNIGAITHVGNMVIHGYPYVWTQEGPYMYTGGWHPMSPENRHFFRDVTSAQFGSMFGELDPDGSTYNPDETRFKFWRGTHDPTWNAWIVGGTVVVDYTTLSPVTGGGFAASRISMDTTEVETQAPGNWQILGKSQHIAAYLKQAAGDDYGGMYMLYQKPHTSLTTADDPPVTDRIICRMDRDNSLPASDPSVFPGRYSPNEWWFSDDDGTITWHGRDVFLPFDFRVLMPHHLAQGDEQSGAYLREGKSYKRLWVHAIHEGTKTRYWDVDEDAGTGTQQAATQGFIQPYPGEESAVLQNENNVGRVEITRSLTNPLEPQVAYTDLTPWDGVDAQNDSRSLFRGAHILPVGDLRLAARGMSIQFYVTLCAEKVRFSGWGAEFGPGSHNMFNDPVSYPFPV
ncbi:MAG: hypothetical protein GY906_24810 [bacterium]|nr:hypothetical protein [bacterium]